MRIKSTLYDFIFIPQWDVPILQRKQPRHREGKQLAQGGTAWKWKEWKLTQAGWLTTASPASLRSQAGDKRWALGDLLAAVTVIVST